MIANKRMFAALFALLSTTALTPLAASAQQAAQNPRIALVIGNATYRDKALATTANDAGLVAQTLQAAGFEVVGARDLDEKSLRTALRDFLDKAAAAGPEMQAFVYLSGRGLQYNGDNFFVPVDAQINRDAEAPIEALRVSDFAHALAATPGRARIIVLDAARANPYAAQGAALAPGLALVEPEPGEVIAFNAAPGTLAGDEQGPYGVYGKTLAGAMRQGGVGIEDVFNQVRLRVNQQTGGALIPWSASTLGAPYYIFERAANAPLPPVAADWARRPIAGFPPAEAYSVALQRDTMQAYVEYLAAYPTSDQARRVRAILAARREAAFWRRSVNINTPHAYWTYLRHYQHGPHVADARRRLAILSARYEPPTDFEPDFYDDLPPPPPDERFYESRPYYSFDDFGPPPPQEGFYYREDDDWRDLPPPPPAREVGVLPVLGVAIPLIAGAVAFHNNFHKDGVAPAGTAPLAPPPPAPPPLPANITPVRPSAPVPVPAAVTGATAVKPLPPITPATPPAAAKPPTNAPAAPAAGNPPRETPAAPVEKPPVAATPPAAAKPPTSAPAAPIAGNPPKEVPAAPAEKPPVAATPPAAEKPPTSAPIAPAAGNPPKEVPAAPAEKPPVATTPPAAEKPPTSAPAAPPAGNPPKQVPAAPAEKPPVAATPPAAAKPSTSAPVAPAAGNPPKEAPVAPAEKPPVAATPPAAAKPPTSAPIAPAAGNPPKQVPAAPAEKSPVATTPPAAAKPPPSAPVAPFAGTPPKEAPVAPAAGNPPKEAPAAPAGGKPAGDLTPPPVGTVPQPLCGKIGLPPCPK